jgi:ATP-dependent Zn protease
LGQTGIPIHLYSSWPLERAPVHSAVGVRANRQEGRCVTEEVTPLCQALGVTYQHPEDDRYNYPEEYLRARIVGPLGCRGAEEIVYGTRTTGAENDIEHGGETWKVTASK